MPLTVHTQQNDHNPCGARGKSAAASLMTFSTWPVGFAEEMEPKTALPKAAECASVEEAPKSRSRSASEAPQPSVKQEPEQSPSAEPEAAPKQKKRKNPKER